MRFGTLFFLSALIDFALAQSDGNSTSPTASPVVSEVSEIPTSGSNSEGTTSPAEIPTGGNTTADTSTPTIRTTNSPASETVTATTCYTNLTEMNILIDQKDPVEKAEFILCPNTEFKIGFFDATGYCCNDGFTAIVPRTDTTIKCGDDGSSANNCTLTGGNVHVVGFGNDYNGERDAENVVLQGITFDNAGDTAVLLAKRGSYKFIDCIFKNHNNIGAIKLVYHPRQDGGGRRLQSVNGDEITMHSFEADSDPVQSKHEDETEKIQARQLQSDDEDSLRQVAVFDGCLFQGNGFGFNADDAHYGVVFAGSDRVDLTINNSRFEANSFIDALVPGDSFAIRIVNGSTLVLQNSCFIGNQFKGRGAVLLDDGAVLMEESGNYGTSDPCLECPFLADGSDDSCLPFSSSTCGAKEFSNQPSRPLAPSTCPPTAASPVASMPTPPTSSAAARFRCTFVAFAMSLVILSFVAVF